MPGRILLSLATMLTMASAGDDPKPPKDEDVIKGTWLITSAMHDGKMFTDAADNVPVGATLKFGKGTFKLGKTKAAELLDYAFDLDPDKSPKEIDITLPDGNTELKGIYSLEGDDLKICVGFPDEPRPKKLKAESDQLRILVILKRQKP